MKTTTRRLWAIWFSFLTTRICDRTRNITRVYTNNCERNHIICSFIQKSVYGIYLNLTF